MIAGDSENLTKSGRISSTLERISKSAWKIVTLQLSARSITQALLFAGSG
jgi:hypothetical protein